MTRQTGPGGAITGYRPAMPKMRKPPPADSKAWKLINALASANKRVYRLTGGRIGGRMGKAPILILHHVGRKSGAQRETPVNYLAEGDRLVVVASKGGVDQHPAWFHNLMAAPEATVEIGRDRRRVRPRIAEDPERAELWPRLVEIYPPYAEYQAFTERRIPVVVLEPA